MKAANDNIVLTQSILKSLLTYDKFSGHFFRVEPYHRYEIGRPAGGVNPDTGYVMIKILGKKYSAHRLAWLYENGSFPELEIDHIDGNRTNNRISNLRVATRQENQHNQRSAASSNKTTGLLGASLHRESGKYRAQIKVGGKKVHIGSFDTPEEAHSAYVAEKRKLHPFGTI